MAQSLKNANKAYVLRHIKYIIYIHHAKLINRNFLSGIYLQKGVIVIIIVKMKWKTAQGSDRLTEKKEISKLRCSLIQIQFYLLKCLLPALKSTERLKDSAFANINKKEQGNNMCLCDAICIIFRCWLFLI